MKFCVHVLLLRMFPLFVICNAAAMLCLSTLLNIPSGAKFGCAVLWCAALLLFIAWCDHRKTATLFFRQVFGKEIEDNLLPQLPVVMHGDVHRIVISCAVLTETAKDAIYLRVCVIMLSCCYAVPLMNGATVPSNTATLVGLTLASVAMTSYCTLAYLSNIRERQTSDFLLAPVVAACVGTVVHMAALFSEMYLQHVFLLVISAATFLIFLWIENKLVWAAGVAVSGIVRDRLTEELSRRR